MKTDEGQIHESVLPRQMIDTPDIEECVDVIREVMNATVRLSKRREAFRVVGDANAADLTTRQEVDQWQRIRPALRKLVAVAAAKAKMEGE